MSLLSYRPVLKAAVLTTLIIAAASTPAWADTITFGNTTIPVLLSAGTQTEGLFTYQAMNGAWEINRLDNDPAGMALYTSFNSNTSSDFQFVGQSLEIKAPGNIFRFASVDYRTPFPPCDQLRITGLLNGVSVGTLLLTNTSTSWQTVVSGFADKDVDTLHVELTYVWNGTGLDNFSLSVVPEPSTAALSCLAVLTLIRRKRR